MMQGLCRGEGGVSKSPEPLDAAILPLAEISDNA